MMTLGVINPGMMILVLLGAIGIVVAGLLMSGIVSVYVEIVEKEKPEEEKVKENPENIEEAEMKKEGKEE